MLPEGFGNTSKVFRIMDQRPKSSEVIFASDKHNHEKNTKHYKKNKYKMGKMYLSITS